MSQSSLALLGPPESGEQALSLALRHLGQLPLPELVVVDEEGGEVEDQTVSHVEETHDLEGRQIWHKDRWLPYTERIYY